MTEPVLIDETRTIDETRHDEVGCNRRHLAGGSPPSPQSVSASNIEGRTRTLTMWVLCADVCGQVHAVWHRWSVSASGGAQGHRTVRGTLTVKGQGGASCGLGLDDVAVRDLRTTMLVLKLPPLLPPPIGRREEDRQGRRLGALPVLARRLGHICCMYELYRTGTTRNIKK